MNLSGLGVRFGSEKNKQFTVCEKSGATAKSRLKTEVILAHSEDFYFTNVQTLLNKNRSVFVGDPIGLIIQSFGLNQQFFIDSIETNRAADDVGWLLTLKREIFRDIPLLHKYRQPHKVDISRRLCFDLVSNDSGYTAYGSSDGSVMALLLHILMNVRVAHKNHWTHPFLKDTKEFVMLIPGNKEHTFAIAVGVVMRLDEKIVMRQFYHTQEIDREIQIGHFLESN